MASNFRKRRRSSEENDDFLPISKRINGLSIRYSTEDPNENTNTLHMDPGHSRDVSQSSQQLDQQNFDHGVNHPLSPISCSSNQNQPPWQQGQGQNNLSHHSILTNGQYKTTQTENGAFTNGTDIQDESMFYEPELSKTENPHYFNANEVLFHANVERIQRRTGNFPR